MSRGNVAKMCAGLEHFSVPVRPEEIAAPTRSVVQRVLGDFANSAFIVSQNALSQPIACNLENYNLDSVVPSVNINRMILFRLALPLLSKVSIHFTLMDVIKPDAKKFEKMVQQMLNYLYHSEKVYVLVNQTSDELDDKAAQFRQLLEALELEKNELSTTLQRVKSLAESVFPDKIAEYIKRNDRLTEQSRVVVEHYNELKERVNAMANEIEQMQNVVVLRLEDLAGIRELVVKDPDSCLKKLRQLQEEVSSQKGQVNIKECARREALQHLQSLQDALERLKALGGRALLLASGYEELGQLKKDCERRAVAQSRILLELDSHLGVLKASVQDRKHQLEKAQQEHFEAQASLQALEEAELQLVEKRKEVEARRRNLADEAAKVASHIERVQHTAVVTRVNVIRQLREGHREQMKIWDGHVKEMGQFSRTCQIADDQLAASYAKTTALSEAIGQLAVTDISDSSNEKNLKKWRGSMRKK